MDGVVNERVSVILVDDINKGTTLPVKLRWRGKDYIINKFGYHHKLKQGRTVIHIFSVCSDLIYFKLSFNSETLHWILIEYYDDGASA